MDADAKKKVIKLILMWLVSIAVLALAYITVVLPIRLAVNGKSNEVSDSVVFEKDGVRRSGNVKK
ncbi:MAG: hypothetical protein FVQ82_06615 [Planctomycetes bacterium]|nr:hypothetical protein [Planctomycetota bacterium]